MSRKKLPWIETRYSYNYRRDAAGAMLQARMIASWSTVLANSEMRRVAASDASNVSKAAAIGRIAIEHSRAVAGASAQLRENLYAIDAKYGRTATHQPDKR